MRIARPSLRVLLLLTAIPTLAFPALAGAHSTGLGSGDSPIDEQAAAALQGELAEALLDLPRETAHGTCAATAHVDGLGDACRTDDGLFRVELASGLTVTTHGPDAPRATDSRAAALAHLPDSQAAIDNASVADIECTSAPGDRRIELIYARPSDKPDRSAALAAPMRQQLYQASAFIDAESQALDADEGRRLRVACSGGVPIIHTVAVRASGLDGGEYDEIVDDIVAAGFPAPSPTSTSARRFMVFYDDQHVGGSAGIAGVWLNDSAGAGNPNNLGGRYAVEFDWSVTHQPHWDVFLHEMTHSMGAVFDGAPDSSRAGHCIDGLDIMCYDDGGTGGTYVTTACNVERYDCGGDTYFHPSPPGGSWLATHWNVGSTTNAWLAARDTGWDDGGVPDLVAPTVPTGLAVTGSTASAVSISWSASTDARSIVRYRVEADRQVNGAWEQYATQQPVSATSTGLSGLPSGTTWRFSVYAYDQANNMSAPGTIQASTVAAPPVAPASAALTIVDEHALDAAWVAGSSSAGVRGHEVEVQRGINAWARVGEVAGTTTRISGLDSGADYRIRVRTIANGGAVSSWRVSSYVTTPGQLAGGGGTLAAPEVSVSVLGPTRAQVTWSSTPGATSWDVELVDPRGSTRSLEASVANVTLSGLAAASTYTVRVVASSDDGASSDPGEARFTTTRDSTPPTASRFLSPRFVGTTMYVSWKRASDDAGVARYELQRKVGRTWKKLPVAGAAVRTTIRGVRRGQLVVLRVRAIDRSGNAARWTTTSVRRR